METITDTFTSKFSPILSLQGNSDFEILKKELGIYASSLKGNWIANSFIDQWTETEQLDVRSRIEKANELTEKLRFKLDYFMDYEKEDDRTWDAGFTLKIENK
jgi:hypothetical protein